MTTISREFILAEIQRVATEIGRPPGKREFLNTTGIKETDWSGRHWARWNDAIREAGLKPNQLQSPHSEAHLLGSLVALIRENNGRFPTRPEMRLKRISDSSFPDAKTFERFGSRAALAERLHSYCHAAGYDDIRAACSLVLSSSASRRQDSAQTRSDDNAEFGFVYLIKSGRHYKVGRSNAVGRRERELAIQLPEKSSTVHVIRTDDPPGIERYWHQRFEAKRKNGEWFELTAADVTAFRRRKFM